MFILVRVSIVTDIQTNKQTNKQTNTHFLFWVPSRQNIYTVHDTRHMKLYGALRAPINYRTALEALLVLGAPRKSSTTVIKMLK